MNKLITVLGIFVADISFAGTKIPAEGETIIGSTYNIGPGGKGCNQAIAISKLGGKVKFISKIGNDEYGKLATQTLKKNKIDLKNLVRTNRYPTGVAGIMVNKKNGRNAINVITGAPSKFTVGEVKNHIKYIKSSKIFLTQLEIPKKITLFCLKTAYNSNVQTILNPAPASKINKEFFRYINYFTPNEIEAEYYTGIKIKNRKDAFKACKKLHLLGVKKSIITLGEKGLCYFDGQQQLFIAAEKSIKAIDTTGAGDAFNGALAFALANDKKIKDALIIANRVAGLSTQKLGAGDSMPSLKELKNF